MLVSTDKAVSPATVMGASKALAEWAVEAAAARHPEHALRDRALRQRARLVRLGRADLPPPDRRRRPGDGHRPRMTRYFMTIPEAVQLIIRSGLAGASAAARCSCSRWASRCGSSTSRRR